jgi:hypothetical protein
LFLGQDLGQGLPELPGDGSAADYVIGERMLQLSAELAELIRRQGGHRMGRHADATRSGSRGMLATGIHGATSCSAGRVIAYALPGSQAGIALLPVSAMSGMIRPPV